MSRFQQHLYHIGLFQEWIYTTHSHTNLWTVKYKDLISSVLPFHITVMGNNLVVLQTKFGSFRRSKQIYSINPEREII